VLASKHRIRRSDCSRTRVQYFWIPCIQISHWFRAIPSIISKDLFFVRFPQVSHGKTTYCSWLHEATTICVHCTCNAVSVSWIVLSLVCSSHSHFVLLRIIFHQHDGIYTFTYSCSGQKLCCMNFDKLWAYTVTIFYSHLLITFRYDSFVLLEQLPTLHALLPMYWWMHCLSGCLFRWCGTSWLVKQVELDKSYR
jgi:hypothetical protein